MKKHLFVVGITVLAITAPLRASAATFSKFFVFGDSLSDTGNVFNATQGAVPPSPPYFNGRFSNSKNWVDFVGDKLNLTPTRFTELPGVPATQGVNFATGGANSGKGNAVVPDAPLPGVLEQVGLFAQGLQATQQPADPNALYALWAGANDYIFGGVTDSSETVKNIANSVGLLTQAGAKNIAVFNLPDLGKLPIVQTDTDPQLRSKQLTEITGLHNTALTNALKGFSGANIINVDVNSLFNRVVANPAEFNFQSATIPCVIGDFANIQSVCTNPEALVFFDAVHPSSKSHNLIAQVTLAAIHKPTTAVPEPSVGLGIIALGALVATKKRKQKTSVLK